MLSLLILMIAPVLNHGTCLAFVNNKNQLHHLKATSYPSNAQNHPPFPALLTDIISRRDVGTTRSHTMMTTQEQELTGWMLTFSATHIGISAIRERLISLCGNAANNLGLVNQGWKLPSYWLGDSVGKNDIFPTETTAGRQIYRAGYTAISFITLGGALQTYLSTRESPLFLSVSSSQDSEFKAICYAVASVASAISIASLFNASPLSLVPGFEADATKIDIENSSLPLQRNDGLKLEPRGLTRITRHPLILPVFPWGIATSYLAGGRLTDFLLFGGLSLYAIAGCACQDLRVLRQEGSVGTVMDATSTRTLDNSANGQLLQEFFAATSFVPFAAVLDGRQSFTTILQELPWIALIAGYPLGGYFETTLLSWLQQA